MRIAYLSTAALALTLGAITPTIALEAPTSRNVTDIRLLPPVSDPMAGAPQFAFQDDSTRALRIVRERHPEVFDRPLANGRYLVQVLMHPDGRVERMEVSQVEGTDLIAGFARARLSPDVSRSSTTVLQKGRPLPDGTVSNSDVTLQVNTLPPNYDPSRSVSRVEKAVRERHANLLLPASGEVLNRLTIFLNEAGQIEREHVEQIRFDSLRRAPLEDTQFAERMTERFVRPLNIDAQKIGVVGFTYVEDGTRRMVMQPGGTPKDAGDLRTLLVQYAWQRKPGEQGPSMPMAARAQQQPLTFDTAAALALAEYHFRDAFGGRESSAGTPTIVLNRKGEVLRVGRVQYRSGEIHETSLQKQLLPGITLDRLISPTLKNSFGASAVVTFVWVADAGK